MEKEDELKILFLKSYSNVTSDIRKQIIVLVEKRPFTWNAAYFEIKNNTSLSKKILKSLNELKII